MSFLQKRYSREDFLNFVSKDFLSGFSNDKRPVRTHEKSLLKEVQKLGDSIDLGLSVFEATCDESDHGKRVAITMDAFRILRDTATRNALIVFYSKESNKWRLSLLTSNFELDSKGKVTSKMSNPRRYSYLLGEDAKTVTPHKYLETKGIVKDFKDLQSRFAVEVVNNDFYKEIAKLYDELVGTDKIKGSLKYPGQGESSHQFAVRLIGRIIFCWFLREKKSNKGTPLIPKEILSGNAAKDDNYYHDVLAPLFFEVLNKRDRGNSRNEKFQKGTYKSIPYLNGGLFNPDPDDHYKFDKTQQLSVPGIVGVPDKWLRALFELLELYNFTVDENTSYDVELSIDPEMLGRIFENLLARINPETGETVRKSTGSFYTPREIVDYMVDSSLVQYLSTSTNIDRPKLEALVSYDLLDDKGNELKESEAESVLEALSTLTVLDPACGSGAFPIGILQKIVFVISILDPDAKWWLAKQLHGASPELRREFENKGMDYIRKLGVIRQTIYGVDIQPIATEISRLRCFLTLVVDEDVDDTQENRGIKPLPNLEFKFVTANSLIKPPNEHNTINASLFEDFGSKLSEKVKEYFSAHGTEKAGLLHNIRDIIDEKVDQNTSYVLNNYGLLKDDRFTDAYNQKNATVNNKLLEEADIWKSYKNIFKHKPVNFFETKYFFPDAEDGFNIVIGNPPYIRHRDLPKSLKDELKATYTTGNTTSDIYCYFYELSYNLLKENGVCTYITSNKWLRAKYGQHLRKFFKQKTEMIEVVDLGSNQFNAATVDTNTMLYIKKIPRTSHIVKFHTKIPTTIDGQIEILQSDLSLDAFSFSDKRALSLLKKIEASGKPLKNIESIKINYGVLTGRNEIKTQSGKEGVFILTEAERSRLVAVDPNSSDLIRPILRGRDIKRYSIEWASKYLLAIHYGFNKKIDEYPAIKQHLLNYEQTLKSRAQVKRGDHHWMELDQNPSKSFMEEFDQKKIIFPIISSVPSFTIDDSGFFHNDKAFHIIGENLYYLLGFLNSKIANWTIRHYGPTLGSGGFEYRKIFIEKLPIVFPDSKDITKIDQLVQNALSTKTSATVNKQRENEEEIDRLFYKIYDLTPEEIHIIEDSIK